MRIYLLEFVVSTYLSTLPWRKKEQRCNYGQLFWGSSSERRVIIEVFLIIVVFCVCVFSSPSAFVESSVEFSPFDLVIMCRRRKASVHVRLSSVEQNTLLSLSLSLSLSLYYGAVFKRNSFQEMSTLSLSATELFSKEIVSRKCPQSERMEQLFRKGEQAGIPGKPHLLVSPTKTRSRGCVARYR